LQEKLRKYIKTKKVWAFPKEPIKYKKEELEVLKALGYI